LNRIIANGHQSFKIEEIGGIFIDINLERLLDLAILGSLDPVGKLIEDIPEKTDDKLSGAAIDTMVCLFIAGPTQDGDFPSKSGRDELVERGFADKMSGHQWLTRKGITLALSLGFDRKKENILLKKRL
jgi:hypothetical protein